MSPSEPGEASRPKKSWRQRPRTEGAYWPIAAAALTGLFLVAPGFSPLLRVSCVVTVLLLLWVAFRFMAALTGTRGRRTRTHAAANESPPRTENLMLALPGLYGYANHVAFGLLYSRAAGDDRYAISVIWLMLVPPLAVASIVGVVVALDRPGPFRVLAVVANGAYVLLAALLAYHCLWPIF